MTNEQFIRCIEKLQSGDINALASVYKQYFGKIYYTAYNILQSKDDAYDVATDVILGLVHYGGNPKEIKNHVGFLITATKNKAYDFIRRSQKTAYGEEALKEVATHISDSLWFDEIINVLTDKERQIFIEYVIWGKSLKKIATELRLPYITIKRYYSQIKTKIKALVKG